MSTLGGTSAVSLPPQETPSSPQVYGWPYGSAGALALVFSVGPFVEAATSHYRLLDSDRQGAALLAVVGVMALVWELWRRRHRVVLMPVRGGIGVYRNGTLQNTASPSEMTLYRWHDSYRFAYLGLAFCLLIMGVATLGMKQDGRMTAYELLLGVLAGTWIASHIWVRSSLARLWLPTRPGKTTSILVRKQTLPLLFGPAAGRSASRR